MSNHALIMLTAGVGIPVLAALNARLGANIGSPSVAAPVLFVVAFLSTAIVASVTGLTSLTQIAAQPKHLFLGGLLVAFYVLSITYVAPTFGIGNAVFFVLLGQLLSAAAIDHFGLFGANVTPLRLTRIAGIAVMGLGVALTQLSGRG